MLMAIATTRNTICTIKIGASNNAEMLFETHSNARAKTFIFKVIPLFLIISDIFSKPAVVDEPLVRCSELLQ